MCTKTANHWRVLQEYFKNQAENYGTYEPVWMCDLWTSKGQGQQAIILETGKMDLTHCQWSNQNINGCCSYTQNTKYHQPRGYFKRKRAVRIMLLLFFYDEHLDSKLGNSKIFLQFLLEEILTFEMLRSHFIFCRSWVRENLVFDVKLAVTLYILANLLVSLYV